MDLIRRHLFYIVCVVAALGGIVLAATGLSAMPEVVTKMDVAKKLYSNLESLKHNPVNQKAIAAEEQRIDFTREDYDKVIEKARSLYHYEPLVPDVFPDGGGDKLREFRRKYGLAMNQLFDSLKSGEPATPADIDAMQDKIDDEEARRRERGLDSGAVEPEEEEEGPARDAAGVRTKSGARSEADTRAHVAKAQSIYCYAQRHRKEPSAKLVPSLDFDPEMVDLGTVDAPGAEFAWRAQIRFWILKDVVDAIVKVNEEAAKAATDDSWVGNMPIKEVISIRVSDDYILPEAGEYAGAAAEGFDEALPPSTADTVFTQTASDRTYEVVQFTIKLVMDQRDTARLVKELTTNSFHTLLRLAYQGVPVNRDMVGKIYGPEPAVIVVMDFQTVMLGDVFRPLMPLVVCERLVEEGYGAECPELEEDEGEEEEEG